MFEVGAQASCDVLPWGESAGELYLELVEDTSYDKVVGVDITRFPVEDIGVVVELDGDISQNLIISLIGFKQLEADCHLHSILRNLHYSILALQEVGGLLRLVLSEIVVLQGRAIRHT